MKALDFEISRRELEQQRPRFEHSTQYGKMAAEIDNLGHTSIGDADGRSYTLSKVHALAFGKWLVEIYGEEELRPI